MWRQSVRIDALTTKENPEEESLQQEVVGIRRWKGARGNEERGRKVNSVAAEDWKDEPAMLRADQRMKRRKNGGEAMSVETSGSENEDERRLQEAESSLDPSARKLSYVR